MAVLLCKQTSTVDECEQQFNNKISKVVKVVMASDLLGNFATYFFFILFFDWLVFIETFSYYILLVK